VQLSSHPIRLSSSGQRWRTTPFMRTMAATSPPVLKVRPSVAVSLVYASSAVTWTSFALLGVVLPFRFQALGLSVVEYGVAIAILALGMLLTESFWGVLAFRIGNIRPIVGLGIVVVLIYAAIGFSTTFLTLAVSLGLLGALVIFPVPLMRWMALTALGPGTGGRGTGLFGLFFGTGIVAGTALGPFIYVDFGFTVLTVVIMASYSAGVALTVFLPWDQVALPRREPGFTRHVRAVFTTPFVIAAVLVVLALLVKSLVWSFLQYYSVTPFQGTPTEAGYVIGAAQATSLVAGVLLGILVDRWGPGRSAPFGFVLMALGTCGTLFSSTYSEMVGATMLFAVGVGWLSAGLLPLALSPVPRPLQGTAIGVFGSFEDFGLLIGPILISTVYATYGVRSVFLTVTLLAVAGAVVSLLSYRSPRATPLDSGGTGAAEPHPTHD
jgi:MFS family permease